MVKDNTRHESGATGLIQTMLVVDSQVDPLTGSVPRGTHAAGLVPPNRLALRQEAYPAVIELQVWLSTRTQTNRQPTRTHGGPIPEVGALDYNRHF